MTAVQTGVAMVSTGVIAGFAFALALSLGAPLAIYFICRRRMTLSWRNIGLGAATFIVFALILEQALHHFVLVANPVTVGWIRANPWYYVIYGVTAAALFEEGGRYIVMRLLVKPTDTPGTGVAFGIGHGGIEAVILGGLAQLQVLAISIMMNLGGRFDAALSSGIPAPQLAALRHQLASLTFFDAAYGGVERIVALLFQIAASLLVWKAVSERKIVYLLAAMAAHAALDFPVAMVQIGLLGLGPMQLILILEGIGFVVFFIWRLPKRVGAPTEATTPETRVR